MALDLKWLHAQLNLAWKVVVHYVRALWPWAPRFGLVRFQENYVVEGLAPATADFRALAVAPGRCTVCGSCDAVCPILKGSGHNDQADFLGPMGFVVAGARAAPYLDAVADTLQVLTSSTCSDCRACDAACPEGIPITALATFLQAQRDVVIKAKQGVVPILPADLGAHRLPARPLLRQLPPAASSPSPSPSAGGN